MARTHRAQRRALSSLLPVSPGGEEEAAGAKPGNCPRDLHQQSDGPADMRRLGTPRRPRHGAVSGMGRATKRPARCLRGTGSQKRSCGFRSGAPASATPLSRAGNEDEYESSSLCWKINSASLARAGQPLPSADTGPGRRKLNSSFLSLKGKEVLLLLCEIFMFLNPRAKVW